MAAAGSSGAARELEEFSERELEVAAILADLPSIVRACNRRRRQQQKQQQARPEIPSWGRRRPRKSPAPSAATPAEKPAADDDGRNGAASPDTPLAFPEDDEHHEASAAAAAEDEAKACAQHKWAQEQRGVVASLSHENAHLLKQIEEFRARLQSSRSTNDSLSQIHHQSKHKKRHRPEGEEEEGRRWRLAGRPALDLNEPAEADAEEGKPPQTAAPAQWFHRGHHQHQQLMQLEHKAARRRRQEIRRAKAAASRMRRLG